MSLANKRCIYNKNHILTIVDKNKGQILERNLNLSINNFDESLVSDYNFVNLRMENIFLGNKVARSI